MKRKKRVLSALLTLVMLAGTATSLAATPAAAASLEIDPYAIDWVVKYEEDFQTAVPEPEEWVRDTYEVQKDEFWGDYGYAEQHHYADNHPGQNLKDALDEFGAYRKSYSFGQDNWLTIESYARNAGDDPATPPDKGGRFIINGDGKAVMVVEKHTDAAVIGSSDPLPSTYRLEVTVKNIDVGGLNSDENGKDVAMDGSWGPWTREEANPYVDYTGKRVNGYFTESTGLSSGPWVEGDAISQNGMYFLGIVDYGNPRPQNNTFIHYHRKLAFDTDNNGPRPWSNVYDANGEKQLDGSRYISMLWLDAYQQGPYTSGCKFFSYTSKDGGTPEEGATMVDKYLPGEEYTFAVVRTPESYTMEVTGNFYYAGQHTYTYTKPHVDANAPNGLSGWTYHFNQTVEELNGLIPPNWEAEYMGETRVDWAADATYPDYFYIGIPHINFYSGTAEFTNITLKVPKGSSDDPAMNVKATVTVEGATAEDKVYDGKTVAVDVDALTITAIDGGADLTEALKDDVTYTWYTADEPDRALSITPKNVGEYIVKVAIEATDADGNLLRGEQRIPVAISKATVTVSADDQSVSLHAEAPTYTYTVSGLGEGDSFAIEPKVSSPSANLSKRGSYPITVGGATLPRKIADNYNEIVYRDGTLRVGSASSSGSGGGGYVSSAPATTPSNQPKVTTSNTADGGSVTTVTYPSGTKAVAETTAKGETTATVTLSAKDKAATVVIPMKNAAPGTVAVLVKEDGSEEIVRKSVMTDQGMLVPVTENVKLKFVDRSTAFTDVPASHWADSAVAYVSSRQLFQGTGNNEFTPTATMTRGMLFTVLARLDGQDTTPAQDEAWYAKGVTWAADKGVSNGQNPEENVTRQELAMLLWRYAGKPETKGSLAEFVDAGSVDAFAEAPMRWAVEQGIVGGKDAKRLDPAGTASRAEVAAMLERFVKATV